MQLDRLGTDLRPRRFAGGLCLAIAALALLLWAPATARADGTLALRGAYYKERSTRVSQPMVDADLEVGETGRLQGHILIDSITSASVAAGADGTPFNEQRFELGGTYLDQIGQRFRLGGGGRVSVEPDYESVFARLVGQVDLAQRNTTLGLALAAGHDEISNAGAQGGLAPAFSADLDTYLGSVSLSQVLSPLIVAGLTYDLIHLRGYQANPYRSVAAGGMLEPERVPDTRWRHAIFGSARVFVPPTVTTLVAGYRFYADDWGILAHTPELRVVQQLTPGLDLHLRYRHHLQGAADFYEPVYDTADPAIEPFITDDDKLSDFSTRTAGVEIDLRLGLLGVRGAWTDARVEAVFEYLWQTTHFGNAVVAQMALVVPLDY